MRNESQKTFPTPPFLESTIAAVLGKCPPGTVFLAAVSGGADSTALLAALVALKDQGFFIEQNRKFELHCIHVEHGIRPEAESKGDAEFVQSLCEKFNVPCRIVSLKPGKIAAAAKDLKLGIEATARLFRRRAWFRELARLKKQYAENNALLQMRILTAHSSDDMLETVLMRMLRGSGPSGLGAMPVSRGRILRPLVTLSRRDVLDYLAEKGIAWREDSTNVDIQFLRNRIRHCLIPSLNEHFPQWRGGITALAETQSLTAEFIKDEAACRIKWGMGTRDQGSGTGGRNSEYRGITRKYSDVPNYDPRSPIPDPQSLFTDVGIFFAQPAIIREEALFQGINKLGLPVKIKRKNIRRFAKGKLTAVDLGSLQIRQNLQYVMIMATFELGIRDQGSGIGDRYSDYSIAPELYSNSSNNNPQSLIPSPRSPEKGFSLLINAHGSYNIKGIALEVNASSKEGTCPVSGMAFLAFLPLVLRPYFKDDRIINKGKIALPKSEFPGQILAPAVITAADPLGPVAFIGINGGSCRLLGRRDDAAVLQPFANGVSHRVVQITIKVELGV
jgi:tRNA(Ile)-lysidine synthase